MAYGTPPFQSPVVGGQPGRTAGMIPITKTGVTLSGISGIQAADSALYAVAMLLGAGIGGALIGWVAAGNKDGALKGASFAAGMTGLTSGAATWNADKVLASGLLVAGAGGMTWSLRGRVFKRR